MSLLSLLKRNLVQTCVYWGAPKNDGEGGFIFDAPVEIQCRWEDKEQVVMQDNGEKILSRSTVYLLQEVDENGMLFLGTLDDIGDSEGDSSGVYYDPQELEGAYLIKRFEKTPSLRSTTEFLYKAFLTPWLT
jgi:hypothetical protein